MPNDNEDIIPDDLQLYLDWFSEYHGNGNKFNQIVINWYEDSENHYIGWHSDNVKQLIDNSPIVSITLGTKRPFSIKNILTNEIDIFNPDHNEYIIMEGNFQNEFKHAVLKKTSKKLTPITFSNNVPPYSRISITLRQVK